MEGHRVVLRVDGAIAGGAQLLARRVPGFGALAYLPYGPLVRTDLPDWPIALLVESLQDECRRNRIRVLCVQPPERGELVANALRDARFRPSDVEVAPAASLRLDLGLSTDELVSKMPRHRRAEMRRSQRDPVAVRIGTRVDLTSFHALHNSSAARKNFTPTPLSYLEAMWDELHPTQQIAVLVASTDDTDVGALIVTRFGDVATDRLRGFALDRLPRRMRPNDALTWTAIDWSRERGAHWYDLGGIGRPEALALERDARDDITDLPDRPDSHKIALGGTPVVYPETLELVPNPALRVGYAALRSSAVARRIRRAMQARGRAASLRSRRLPRGRRAFDLVVAVALLAILSPVLAAVALLIRVASGGPVLFRQQRVGWRGQPFTLLKFRTMVPNHDDSALRSIVALELAGAGHEENGSFKLADDPRITRLGAWLRRTSIDELPQLINVVRGQMSLVGPRPALLWEHESFGNAYRRRIEVRPGITGLWQVSGRSLMSTPEMLQLDVQYVDSRSLRLDLSIMIRTIPTIVRGDGAR
jgi:lipopolysaccharide/colanic/teichoic acid biosynthesis glycosyltransferase